MNGTWIRYMTIIVICGLAWAIVIIADQLGYRDGWQLLAAMFVALIRAIRVIGMVMLSGTVFFAMWLAVRIRNYRLHELDSPGK